MKTTCIACILLVISGLGLATAPSHAQTDGPLLILWQATYGPGVSSSGDAAVPYDFVLTDDGGLLIAGLVAGPTNGIRTPPICAGSDVWVIKIDAQGQLQWDRSCGGDITWMPGDMAWRIFLTAEGGFLLAGMSASEPGCCKTAPLLGQGNRLNAWVVRYDADGNKLWDQSYLPGALGYYTASDFEATADGGYLSCGAGGFGETGGFYGIVKFDVKGQQLWTKTIGCQSAAAYSEPTRIRETADGGFIVAGASNLQPCADKTSPFFGGYDATNPYLGSDVWLIRCDPQQNKLWDKSYGGQSLDLALDLHPLADGGVMVFGASQSLAVTSPTKGTKTSPRYGGFDFWVVRIDAQGNQLWDRSYGGVGDDFCTCAEPMPDGGWLLSGTSTSVPGANKTSPRFGASDIWIVRIDDQGNKLWEQSFGGKGAEGKTWRTAAPPPFLRERIKRKQQYIVGLGVRYAG